MSDLTNARNEINLIDKEMAELFEIARIDVA